jgi:hypothetical protein
MGSCRYLMHVRIFVYDEVRSFESASVFHWRRCERYSHIKESSWICKGGALVSEQQAALLSSPQTEQLITSFLLYRTFILWLLTHCAKRFRDSQNDVVVNF